MNLKNDLEDAQESLGEDQKFTAELPKYDALLSQFGRSAARGDAEIKDFRKPASSLVGPIAKKVLLRCC